MSRIPDLRGRLATFFSRECFYYFPPGIYFDYVAFDPVFPGKHGKNKFRKQMMVYRFAFFVQGEKPWLLHCLISVYRRNVPAWHWNIAALVIDDLPFEVGTDIRPHIHNGGLFVSGMMQ
jgi:hypothetical protein